MFCFYKKYKSLKIKASLLREQIAGADVKLQCEKRKLQDMELDRQKKDLKETALGN